MDPRRPPSQYQHRDADADRDADDADIDTEPNAELPDTADELSSTGGFEHVSHSQLMPDDQVDSSAVQADYTEPSAGSPVPASAGAAAGTRTGQHGRQLSKSFTDPVPWFGSLGVASSLGLTSLSEQPSSDGPLSALELSNDAPASNLPTLGSDVRPSQSDMNLADLEDSDADLMGTPSHARAPSGDHSVSASDRDAQATPVSYADHSDDHHTENEDSMSSTGSSVITNPFAAAVQGFIRHGEVTALPSTSAAGNAGAGMPPPLGRASTHTSSLNMQQRQTESAAGVLATRSPAQGPSRRVSFATSTTAPSLHGRRRSHADVPLLDFQAAFPQLVNSENPSAADGTGAEAAGASGNAVLNPVIPRVLTGPGIDDSSFMAGMHPVGHQLQVVAEADGEAAAAAGAGLEDNKHSSGHDDVRRSVVMC